MESANNHHHHHHDQFQDQVVGSSSSSSTPYYAVGTTTHAWGTTPTSFVNINNGLITPYSSEPILNSRNYVSDMAQDFGFHNWSANTTSNFITDPSVLQSEHLSRTKEEFSDHYYRKYTDLLTGCNRESTSTDDEQSRTRTDRDFGTTSSDNHMNKNMDQIPPGNFLYGSSDDINGVANDIRRGFGQIFSSINVSNLSDMGLTNAGDDHMNLEALDLLTSSSFSGNRLGASSQNQIGILSDGFSNCCGSFGDRMQQSDKFSSYGSDEITAPISNGTVEAKRSSSKMAPVLSNATKKSRLEARASSPPFKVRKEKLGDRVASLQQLVAPFGKTDTASVLMEAIGYIKFLQDQVETLSIPYMKPSRNKSSREIEGGHNGHQNETDDEPKRDLKSRGLCLVPLSCLSYITDHSSVAAVWPPPYFGGPT